MATILDKDLTRETTLESRERNILITITADQRIILRLKGLKSGEVSISIMDLWDQLLDEKPEVIEKSQPHIKVSQKISIKSPDNPMISLYDLRTENLIGDLDYGSKMKFEKLICELIKREIKL